MSSDPATLTRAQARAFDRWAIDELGLPGAVLMENAARSTAEVALAELGARAGPAARVVILCGSGNNGGDGYAVARQLLLAGVRAELWSSSGRARASDDASLQRRVVEGLGLRVGELDSPASIRAAAAGWEGADLLIDALVGTGFQGELRAPLDLVIARANSVRSARRLAVDLPSGLDCDTGRPAANTFRADVTVTFSARKCGFDAPGAEAWTGRVVVASIGVPLSGGSGPWRGDRIAP